MPTITNLAIDPTGILIDNKIINELHENIDYFTKIIIPVFGNYFSDNLVITDINDVVLIKDTDYACIEFNQEQSLKYGKQIFSAILIIANLSVVKITYQALGGDNSRSRKELLDAYSGINLNNPQIEYSEIQLKPEEFKPKKHLHGIDTIYGFEFVVKQLIKIKKAIEITEIPAYNSLLSYVDTILQTVKDRMEQHFDNETIAYINKFLEGINKKYFDVDNLSNLSAASEFDGRKVGAKEFTQSHLTLDKYGTIESLVGLKNVLYQFFIEKYRVGIGYSDAKFQLPLKEVFLDLGNGSIFSVISEKEARENDIKYDEDLYPRDTSIVTDFAINKVSNNRENRGGVLLGINQATLRTYSGALLISPRTKVVWHRKVNKDEISQLSLVADRHIVDYGNPHEVNKRQIGLSLVENLPVVNKEDILAVRSVHKYLTFDSLLYFMRTFLLQNGKKYTPTETNNKFIIDNCVVVYTPAGVKCKTKCDVTEPLPVTYVLRKNSQACMSGDSYVPPGAEEGYTEPIRLNDRLLTGNYSAGSTTINQAIKHFSSCCGYKEEVAEFSFNLSNTTEWNSETSISNIPHGSYFTIKVIYPESPDTFIRVSGVYPRNYYSFKSGYSIGAVRAEVTNRYFVSKSQVYDQDVTDLHPESNLVNNPQAKVYLYIDRKYIYPGKTANAEIYIDRKPGSAQINFPITWKKLSDGSILNLQGLPASLTAANINQRIIKQQFTIPFNTQLNNDGIVASITFNDGNDDVVEDSNPLEFESLNYTYTRKTLPLYENNVFKGEIVISRENETGRISVEGITLPNSVKTSDVYFLRSGGTSNSATVTGVIDVWVDPSQTEEWEFPLPFITPQPTVSPTTTQQPSSTLTSSSTQAPTSTNPPTTTLTPTTTSVITTTTNAPTTTLTPVNLRSVSKSFSAQPVPAFGTSEIVVTIDGVNIGTTYQVGLYTDLSRETDLRFYYYNGTGVNSYNHVATANPLIVRIPMHNEDYAGHPSHNRDVLFLDRFGETYKMQVRVSEIGNLSNFKQSPLTNLQFEPVISDSTFTLPNGSTYKLYYHSPGRIYLFSTNPNAFTGTPFSSRTMVIATSNGIDYGLPIYNGQVRQLNGGSAIDFSYNLQGLGSIQNKLTASTAKTVSNISIIQQ